VLLTIILRVLQMRILSTKMCKQPRYLLPTIKNDRLGLKESRHKNDLLLMFGEMHVAQTKVSHCSYNVAELSVSRIPCSITNWLKVQRTKLMRKPGVKVIRYYKTGGPPKGTLVVRLEATLFYNMDISNLACT